MVHIKQFVLNGELYLIEQNLNIIDLLTYFNYNKALLVLEYNGFIYNKMKWKTTFIKNQDQIEIVTIVGGG